MIEQVRGWRPTGDKYHPELVSNYDGISGLLVGATRYTVDGLAADINSYIGKPITSHWVVEMVMARQLPCLPPFPATWVEYSQSPFRVGVLLTQDATGVAGCVWKRDPPGCIVCCGSLEWDLDEAGLLTSGGKLHAPWPDSNARGSVAHLLSLDYWTALATCAILHIKNADLRVRRADARAQAIRAKRGQQPLAEWRELVWRPTVWRETVAWKGGDRRGPRWHEVRAHVRHTRHGAFLVRAHARGDLSKGIVRGPRRIEPR